jgi:hypothetical protein
MPFEYERIRNTAILPGMLLGTILDIGCNGLLAEMADPVEALSDLKVHMHFARGGKGDTDVYARVVRTFEREGRTMACIEFTSLSSQATENIRRFVQMLLQGGGDH